VVEDDEDTRRLLESLLTAEGYSVTAVEGGKEALRRLQRGRYRAVLSDMRLGDYHGAVLVRLVRRHWPKIPVVLMTAFPGDPMISEALAGGIAAFVAKPFQPAELLETLRRALAP
jgi:CheY-like chemotaxis protein